MARQSAVAIRAHLSSRAHRPARPAIREVRHQICAHAIAIGQVHLTRQGTRPIGTDFARSTRATTHSAMIPILGRIDTCPTAIGQTRLTRQCARSTRTNFAIGAGSRAHSAMVAIFRRVHARTITIRQARLAGQCATSARTNFARRARCAARAAIVMIRLRVYARPRTIGLSCDTIEHAHAIRTSLIRRARLTTCATIRRIRVHIDAEARTIRLSRSTARISVGRALFTTKHQKYSQKRQRFEHHYILTYFSISVHEVPPCAIRVPPQAMCEVTQKKKSCGVDELRENVDSKKKIPLSRSKR